MRRTRGPAVYGSLHLENYQEDDVAWSWAKAMMRKQYPRCKLWQDKSFVVATTGGKPIACWIKNVPGEEVGL